MPPRWAWWVGGIAIPLLGIVVSVIVSGGRDAAAPAPISATGSQTAVPTPTPTDPAPPAPSPTLTAGPTVTPRPSGSTTPSADTDLTPPAGHGPARKATWGLAPAPCTQHEQQLVDLDTGESRVEQEDNGAVANPGGAELLYWPDTCTGIGDYVLRALPNTRVGLLRADAPRTAEACKAAAGTGFAALPLYERRDTKERGFTVGAALCAVTADGAVAMALIDHMSGGATTDVSVSGNLYVWPQTSN